ncbi:MAG: hypothetical protein RMK35_03685 [Aquificaceae bacterium]|nr:hypothetical protein [Aquificaceae bacterium]MDW8433888.1 hypothetical protein [Aquificaceae bacterium]
MEDTETFAGHSKAIVSKAFQMVYGRYIRYINEDFYEVFEKLMSKIPEVSFEEGELEEF